MAHRSLPHDDSSAGPSRSVQAIAQRELERIADRRRREDEWNPRRRMPTSVSDISNRCYSALYSSISIQYPSPPPTNPTSNKDPSPTTFVHYNAHNSCQRHQRRRRPTITNDENVHPLTNISTTANNHTDALSSNTVISSCAPATVYRC